MSLGLWPDAVPFDPERGGSPAELRAHFRAADLPAAVLLVCARGLHDSEWPVQAAIGLARALADGTRPVVLADLEFESPRLHTALGEANAEGVADALLFGASLERVTLSPAGESFEFVPAGPFAPEPEELLSHAGWGRLLAELAARNALLLAYVPLGAPGLDALAENRITSVIALTAEDELAQTVARLPETIRLDGVIRPPAPPPPEPEVAGPPPATEAPPAAPPAASTDTTAPPAGEPVFEAPPWAAAGETLHPKEAARRALAAELQQRQRASAAMHATNGEPHEDEAAPPPPPPPPRPEPIALRAAKYLWSLWRNEQPKQIARIAGAIALLAIVSWFVGRLLASRGDDTIGSSGPVSAGGPAEPAGVILNYSVAVEAYDQFGQARNRADTLAAMDSVLSYYIAPVVVDGTLFYRVLAGPLVDSASAAAAMRTLVDRGWKAAMSAYDVRHTPLAFLLGRFESRDSAVQRKNELMTQSVPTYVIEVPYTSGPSRYHLYGGAYAADSEAAAMREIIRRNGLLDTLVLRLGRGTP